MKEDGSTVNVTRDSVEVRHDPCCDCRGCCVYPMGYSSVGLVIVSVMALILTIGGMGSCNFIRVNGLGWGLLWREQTYEEKLNSTNRHKCTAWGDNYTEEFDTFYKVGIVFAYFAIATIILTSATSFSLACSTLNKVSLKLLGFFFLLDSAFQALAFTVLGSDICDDQYVNALNTSHDNCTLSFGAGMAIGGMAFSVLAAIGALTIPPIPYERPNTTVSPMTADAEATIAEEHHDEDAAIAATGEEKEKAEEFEEFPLDEKKSIESDAAIETTEEKDIATEPDHPNPFDDGYETDKEGNVTESA